MESLREAIGAQLAEELREQVNHLSAALQLLTPVVQEQGEQRYGQYLAIANQSIYRLIRTINHLEDIRLPEREAAGMGPLDLAGLCSQTAKQVCSLAERPGVSFRYDSERESLLSCGDGALLERMLLGLISNALKWAGEDKTGERAGEAGLHLARGPGAGRSLPCGTMDPACTAAGGTGTTPFRCCILRRARDWAWRRPGGSQRSTEAH